MSTNLKTKEENWTREEVAVLLEEVEKNEAYLFETAPIHRDKDDFERPWTSPHTSWKLPVAKHKQTVKLLKIGLLIVWYMSGGFFFVGLGQWPCQWQQIQYTDPTEAVLGNKFLIAKAI